MRGRIIRCAAQLCEKRSACVQSDTEKDSTFLEVMKNSSTNCHATVSVSSSSSRWRLNPLGWLWPPPQNDLKAAKNMQVNIKGLENSRFAVSNSPSIYLLFWPGQKWISDSCQNFKTPSLLGSIFVCFYFFLDPPKSFPFHIYCMQNKILFC